MEVINEENDEIILVSPEGKWVTEKLIIKLKALNVKYIFIELNAETKIKQPLVMDVVRSAYNQGQGQLCYPYVVHKLVSIDNVDDYIETLLDDETLERKRKVDKMRDALKDATIKATMSAGGYGNITQEIPWSLCDLDYSKK